MKIEFFWRFFTTSSFFFITLTNLHAQSETIVASISKDMNHFDVVATITKQNEHYQPYIISVFHGKELEKLGISNLKEALGLVPGVDMTTDNFNNQTPIFRGSNSLAYGQTKLFIDDVLVNNLFFDSYSEYLSMPIEMIKRIEIVRGPGSKTNGVNAYAGSINVITYAEDFQDFESKDKLVFKYGSYDYRMGGFIKKFKTEDFDATIDFYYQEDDKKLPAGPDGLSQGILSFPAFGIDNRSLSQNGDAPVWLQDYSLSANLTYKDLYLKARMLDHTQGSAYGNNFALAQENDRLKLPSYYLELGYDTKMSDVEVTIKAGVKYDTADSKAKVAPDGLNHIDVIRYRLDGTVVPITFAKGVYAENIAKQRTLYQSTYVTYTGIEKHIITAGYRLIKEETIDMVSKLSNRSTGDVALVDYTDTFPFFDKNAKRNTQIFSLQDELQYSDNLSFIYGFNYEQTSYEDAGFNPRVSMVYQKDFKNIFKAIYSCSHRNASWQEMYTMNNLARVGSTDLEPEKVHALEVAYIKKFSKNTYFQTNLFYLMNKNQIYNSATDPLYKNVLDTNIYGLELEYAGDISLVDKFYVNYSYITGNAKVKDTGVNTDLTNVAHHLAKGYYIYTINNALALSTIAKYVGAKERVSSDTREKVPAYATLDATLNYKNRKYDFEITLSAKNIFDAKVIYPSPPNTYVEDYAQEGRNFLVTLKKEF